MQVYYKLELQGVIQVIEVDDFTKASTWLDICNSPFAAVDVLFPGNEFCVVKYCYAKYTLHYKYIILMYF